MWCISGHDRPGARRGQSIAAEVCGKLLAAETARRPDIERAYHEESAGSNHLPSGRIVCT